MKTKALRLYGENDIRVEEFELPQLKDDEILAKIISDSLCMSSYKAAIQGARHKRVPNDVAENPIMLGHEFCGVIEAVGAKWQDKFKAGDKFVIQPALNYKGRLDAPGYSFPYIGGCATYIIIPSMVMEVGCLLPYNSDTFFYGSLAEPVSCVIGSYEEFFHSKPGTHKHDMGIKEGEGTATYANGDTYTGEFVIESFDPRALMVLRKIRPDIIRGQLAQNFMKETAGMGRPIDLVLTLLLDNALTRPDFVAYQFEDRHDIGNRLCRKLWKVTGVSWTIRSKADLEAAEAEGLLPIFERFDPRS